MWHLTFTHDCLQRDSRESSLSSIWGSSHLGNNTLHNIRGVGWGSNTAGKGTLCSVSWGHSAFSLLPPFFLPGRLVSFQVMKLSFSVVDTLLCPFSISFPLDLQIWKQIHFNDLSQFKLGFLLFQPKASKPIMFVSLSTPEHPEGIQYILVGKERHKKKEN